MAKTLKVITHNKPTDDASSVDGSLAKAISDGWRNRWLCSGGCFHILRRVYG